VNRIIKYREKFTYNGFTLSIPEWSKRTGISANRIRRRLREGVSIDSALKEERINGTNVINRKYGMLTVKEDVSIDGMRWLRCQCECGNDTIVKKTQLVFGGVKSCGCTIGRPPVLAEGEAALNSLFMGYQRGARKRGVSFNLSIKEFVGLTSSNCFYCGILPIQNKDKHARYRGVYLYNGIDRIDSDVGYVTKNCVPCCKMCNLAKRDVSIGYFISWIHRASNHLNNQGFPIGSPVRNPSLLPDKSILPAFIIDSHSDSVA
jgi:hypothetical protein